MGFLVLVPQPCGSVRWLLIRCKKAERKDTPAQERWVCCDPVDCRLSTHPLAVGMTAEDVQGLSLRMRLSLPRTSRVSRGGRYFG